MQAETTGCEDEHVVAGAGGLLVLLGGEAEAEVAVVVAVVVTI